MTATATTAKSLIKRVSETLSDQCENYEFATFSEELLAQYLNEAMCQILALRPDAFAEVIDLPLESGDCQTVPDGYHSLLSLVGIDEKSEASASQTSAELDKYFRKSVCVGAPSTKYAASGYSINTYAPSNFTIDPPVPDGVSASVKATAARKPDPFCVTDLDKELGISCEHEAALFNWVMMRAHAVEIESETSRQWSAQYGGQFYAMFNVNYLQAQRYGSGYALGREGDGDARFRAR